jgi:hypothetical protein
LGPTYYEQRKRENVIRQLNRIDHWPPQEVLQQLEDSLRAFRTDYIDIYQFHSGKDEMFDRDELWTLLDKQVQAGKVGHLGISIGSNDNLYQTEASTKVFRSALKPFGDSYLSKTVDFHTGKVSKIITDPATKEKINQNDKSNGRRRNWKAWISKLKKADVLAKGVITAAFSSLALNPLILFIELERSEKEKTTLKKRQSGLEKT